MSTHSSLARESTPTLDTSWWLRSQRSQARQRIYRKETADLLTRKGEFHGGMRVLVEERVNASRHGRVTGALPEVSHITCVRVRYWPFNFWPYLLLRRRARSCLDAVANALCLDSLLTTSKTWMMNHLTLASKRQPHEGQNAATLLYSHPRRKPFAQEDRDSTQCYRCSSTKTPKKIQMDLEWMSSLISTTRKKLRPGQDGGTSLRYVHLSVYRKS